MNISASLYDNTGRIVQIIDTDDRYLPPSGLSIVAGNHNPETEYIQDDKPVPRPQMPLTVDKNTVTANGIDTLTISGIPDGAKVINDAESTIINGGDYYYNAVLPGFKRIKFILFPYIDHEIIVEAI